MRVVFVVPPSEIGTAVVNVSLSVSVYMCVCMYVRLFFVCATLPHLSVCVCYYALVYALVYALLRTFDCGAFAFAYLF